MLPLLRLPRLLCRPIRPLLAMIGVMSAGVAPAAGAILLWPVNPTISVGHAASAIWLENQGDQPTVMQVRLFGWSQDGPVDRYRPQDAIVASPPMATIAPGARQLIRLTDTRPMRARGEEAYRVVLDEIPTGAGPGIGVRFQMRYSLPLFVTGGDSADAAMRPDLACSMSADGRGMHLRIRNTGPAHARLTNVRLESGRQRLAMSEGLFGYALPGGGIDHALPPSATYGPGARLHAEIAPGHDVDIPCG